MVKNAIIGEETTISENCQIGATQVLQDESQRKITVVGKALVIEAGTVLKPGAVV